MWRAQEERLFLIREGARLIGCAPMRRTTDAFGPAAGRLGLRGTRLRFLAPLDTELPGPPARLKDEQRVAQALISHWLASEPDWGMLELVGQRPQGYSYRAAHGVTDGRFRVRDIAVEPYNEIPLVWANVHGYFHSLNKKMRSNVSRLARHLYAAGEPELVLASGAGDQRRPGSRLIAIWTTAVGSTAQQRIHQPQSASRAPLPRADRWSRRPGSLVCRRPAQWCVGGGPGLAAPTATSVPDGHGTWCLEIAYDRSLASLGPGHLLLLIAAATAIERGDRHLHFMQNFAYYKHRWGAPARSTS